MPWAERLFNILVGLSVISWAVLGLLQSLASPRWVIAALNVTVGLLLMTRSKIVEHGSTRAILASLPGLVVAGVALESAPSVDEWRLTAQALFAGGGALAILSFLFLGRSFAVLPARRAIVHRGPYRAIRHPAYAGELIMIAASIMAGPRSSTALIVLVALPLVALRIVTEERVLKRDPAYQTYTKQVRFRLIPLIW